MSVRLWKGVVIAMGGLIVVGLIVVAVALVQRAGRLGGDTAPTAADAHTTLPVPAGAALVGTAVSADRLALTLRLADGTTRVVVLALPRGTILGTVDLQPAP
jgi:hypothetical protein